MKYQDKDCQDLLTIRDFLRYAYTRAEQSQLFYGHGTDNPADDMRQLILDSLSLPYDIPDEFMDCRLTQAEKKMLFERIEKRIDQHVPVPYLTHKAYFCDLPFYVDERVLIPRSPFAELIQQHFSPWVDVDDTHRILDMCTGSACMAIACCYAFPEAEVDAVDISSDALDVAEINLKKHGLEEQLHLIQSDCFDNVPANQYDLIISNPPYVGDEEMSTLPKEYLHEPSLALRADDEGLKIVDKILRQSINYLTDKGVLIMEVGNSDELVMERYQQLPVIWLEFEQGGHGVFMVTAEHLNAYFKG